MCLLGFEASLSLSFSGLFWVISPPVSSISRSVLGWGYCGFHSLLQLLLLLSVGGSCVGGFLLTAGVLVFTAPTYLSDFSTFSTIFGLQSSYMLGYHWLFALFLGRSARCFTPVQREVDSTPTCLAAIFLPWFSILEASQIALFHFFWGARIKGMRPFFPFYWI